MTLANNQYFENYISELMLLLHLLKNNVKCAETSHILRHNQHVMKKNTRHITVATNKLQQLPSDNPKRFPRSLSDEKLKRPSRNLSIQVMTF